MKYKTSIVKVSSPMKKILMTTITLLIIGALTTVYGQEKNFVISTGNPHHIPVIIKSANKIAEEYQGRLGTIAIVLYGDAVQDLDQKATSQPWFQQVKSEAIKFKACHLALDKRDVDESLMPKQFEVVPNALVYILKLKDKGYIAFDF